MSYMRVDVDDGCAADHRPLRRRLARLSRLVDPVIPVDVTDEVVPSDAVMPPRTLAYATSTAALACGAVLSAPD